MYAVICSGGKQYKVKPGDVIRVEKRDEDLGAELQLTDVLFLGGCTPPIVGEPQISSAKVMALVTAQARGPKVLVFKKKRRQGYKRMKGHRQDYTELFVKSLTLPSGEVIGKELGKETSKENR